MTRFYVFAGAVLLAVGASTFALAQGPPPQPAPTCEEQLNNEMFQKGGLLQQLAVARAQLTDMTKARDDAKAALAKAVPAKDAKPAEEKK